MEFLPISLVAFETGGTVGHAFSVMDDEVGIAVQVHLCTQVHGDAAPALKPEGSRGTVGHTATLVVVVEAG